MAPKMYCLAKALSAFLSAFFGRDSVHYVKGSAPIVDLWVKLLPTKLCTDRLQVISPCHFIFSVKCSFSAFAQNVHTDKRQQIT